MRFDLCDLRNCRYDILLRFRNGYDWRCDDSRWYGLSVQRADLPSSDRTQVAFLEKGAGADRLRFGWPRVSSGKLRVGPQFWGRDGFEIGGGLDVCPAASRSRPASKASASPRNSPRIPDGTSISKIYNWVPNMERHEIASGGG